MANIAENKFFISLNDCPEDKEKLLIERLDKVFNENLNGDYDYEEGYHVDGWFDSRWNFPNKIWEEILDDIPVYGRFLTEEYGCGLVSMNIHDEDGYWREPQYFDL